MSTSFAKWLRVRIRELDIGADLVGNDPQLTDRAASIRDEAARRAASLGLTGIYQACPTTDNAGAVVEYLSRVLAALPEPAGALTVQQAAERSGIPVRTLYRMVEQGKLPHTRVGTGRGSIRIKPATLDRLLEPEAPPKDYLFG